MSVVLRTQSCIRNANHPHLPFTRTRAELIYRYWLSEFGTMTPHPPAHIYMHCTQYVYHFPLKSVRGKMWAKHKYASRHTSTFQICAPQRMHTQTYMTKPIEMTPTYRNIFGCFLLLIIIYFRSALVRSLIFPVNELVETHSHAHKKDNWIF